MSRKETIIIAVILNVGLLALLFVFATREEEGIIEKSELSQTVVEVFEPLQSRTTLAKPVQEQLIDTGTDEVDFVLKDFAMSSRNHADLSTSVGEEYSPPAPLPPSAFNTDDYVEVTVKRGDALEKIARANGTTVDAIKKANRLATDKLKIGQVLLIPMQQKANLVATHSATEPLPVKRELRKTGDQKVYIVKSGDNPWKIAKQFQISVDELLRANHLDEERARNLKIGQQLLIP